MLRTLLYNFLMGVYRFVMGVEVADVFVDFEKRGKAGKAVLRVQNIGEKIVSVALYLGYVFFMITITGGLYLIWIGFKLIRFIMCRKHKDKKLRKRG